MPRSVTMKRGISSLIWRKLQYVVTERRVNFRFLLSWEWEQGITKDRARLTVLSLRLISLSMTRRSKSTNQKVSSISSLILQGNSLPFFSVSCFWFHFDVKMLEPNTVNLHRALKRELITLTERSIIKYLNKLFYCKKFWWIACQILFGLQVLTMNDRRETLTRSNAFR